MKFPSCLVLPFILCSFSVIAQEEDFKAFYVKGIEAYRNKNYTAFYSLISRADQLHPDHEGILYQLGVASALTGHKTEAINALKKALMMNNSLRIEGLADFNGIKEMPEFKNLLALQQKLNVPIIGSDTAFVIKDPTLHCEGLEAVPEKNTFYAGSIHQRKIVKVKDGAASDFCASGADGMTAVFGLRIDSKNNFLWACTSPVAEMENFDSTARSALYKFDLASGGLLERIRQPLWKKDGIFGDMVVDRNGTVYVSDGQTNTIFIVNVKTRNLEPWFAAPEFVNLQGMTFSDNEKYLFVADFSKGIFRLDMKTKSLIQIKSLLPLSLKGIDGLSFYKNSLIAIQNGINPVRVTRYFLDAGQTQLVNFEIIDSKHPAFGAPTQGVVRGDVFYYIANSQWDGYDRGHRIKPAAQLHDIVALKYKLR